MTTHLNIVRLLFVLFSFLLLAPRTLGGEFQWGDATVSFNSQLSIGSSWRVEDRDLALVTPGNTMGMGTASAATADDGNLNFDKGDVYSLIIKGIHDLEISKGDYGVFLRAKYWYDEELDNGIRPHGNLLNAYAPNEKLNDSDFDDFAKSSGFELLDAYLFGSFTLGEDTPLDLRIGRQVLSWGESTFIQNGINIINPVDVSAFRRPGAEIKEGLLPVNLFSASAGLSDSLSVDFFYQLEWEKTVIDGCGTYFSDVDVGAQGCDGVTLSNAFSDRASLAGGLAVRRIADIEPGDSGQWGLSFRYFAEKLNGSEFGLYYINHHSRVPLLGGITSSNMVLAAGAPLFIPGDLLGGNPRYTAEFPEDIEVFGVTFATNLTGFAVSGEVSYRPEQPVQINTNDILITAVANAAFSPVTPRATAAGPGVLLPGYDRLPVTQAQVTVIKFFEQIFGADRLSIGAEIGANFVGSLPPQSQFRYGRSSNFGNAFAPIPVTSLGIPIPGDFLTCEAGYSPPAGSGIPPINPANSNPANCALDGFVTDTSWGYRIRSSLTYSSAFAGINLTPSLAWSHDVDGYSPNTNFLEDRKALSVALGAEYLNKYSASLAYTTFFDGDYNTQVDRDFVSLSFDMTF